MTNPFHHLTYKINEIVILNHVEAMNLQSQYVVVRNKVHLSCE